MDSIQLDNLNYRIKQLEKVLYTVGDSIKNSSLPSEEKQKMIWKLQAGIFIEE